LQDVARRKEDEKLRPSGVFPHDDGMQGSPIELPFAGHRMACYATLESGCSGLLATFDSWGDL
jgi:hypothetical protein